MSKLIAFLAAFLFLGAVSAKMDMSWPAKHIGFKLLKHDIHANRMQNQLYSPISLAETVGVMVNSGNDQLRDEMMKVIMLNKTDEIAMMNSEFERMMPMSMNRQEMIKHKLAIGIQNGITMKPDFESKMNKQFPMAIHVADLQKPDFVSESNAKINEKTAGKIKKMFLRDDMKMEPDANMLMVSIAYTNKLQPDNVKSMKMSGKLKMESIDKKMVEKDMIRINGEMLSIVDDEKVIFMIPMKGNMSFIGMMPKMDFNKYMKEKFDCDKLKAEIMRMYQQKKEMVDLKMPHMHIDREYKLSEIMQVLGANRDTMIKPNVWPMIGDQLKLSDLSTHRTMLMIDVGTEKLPDTIAGAKEIIINRPFLFVVKDMTTHMPMMNGMMTM